MKLTLFLKKKHTETKNLQRKALCFILYNTFLQGVMEFEWRIVRYHEEQPVPNLLGKMISMLCG